MVSPPMWPAITNLVILVFFAGMAYRRLIRLTEAIDLILKNHLPHIETRLDGIDSRISHIEGRFEERDRPK